MICNKKLAWVTERIWPYDDDFTLGIFYWLYYAFFYIRILMDASPEEIKILRDIREKEDCSYPDAVRLFSIELDKRSIDDDIERHCTMWRAQAAVRVREKEEKNLGFVKEDKIAEIKLEAMTVQDPDPSERGPYLPKSKYMEGAHLVKNFTTHGVCCHNKPFRITAYVMSPLNGYYFVSVKFSNKTKEYDYIPNPCAYETTYYGACLQALNFLEKGIMCSQVYAWDMFWTRNPKVMAKINAHRDEERRKKKEEQYKYLVKDSNMMILDFEKKSNKKTQAKEPDISKIENALGLSDTDDDLDGNIF